MVSPTWTAPWSAAGVTCAFLLSTTSGSGVPETTNVDGPLGGLVSPWLSVPVAVAVSVTEPRSTSAWVTMYTLSAVHVSEAPGARPGAAGVGHVTAPMLGSVTASDARSTLPVLVTRYEYEIVSPTESGLLAPSEARPILARLTAGDEAMVGTVAVDGLLGGLVIPWVSVPVAVVVSTTLPASTSAWVTR